MGRQNIAFLYGRVSKTPVIQKDPGTGQYVFGMVYIDTVRSSRAVDDGLNFVKHEHPLVITREADIAEKIADWQVNDMVFIKGVVTSKTMQKRSYCPNCHDEAGNSTVNAAKGNLVYITPIFAERIRSYTDKQEAVEDLVKNREISNQVYVVGTLIQEPKIFTTKRGIQITQYPIAINRKYTIRDDDPSIRTDWPIVKSYGEQARNDKVYLKYQAEVLVDGFLQARTVRRKVKCKNCGEIYEYADHAMEIVPYDVEYLTGYRSRDEVEAEKQQSVEAIKQGLFESGTRDTLDENMTSTDIA